MKVLVLGCGPAGLLAAHAASYVTDDIVVVSKKVKSTLYGCQYLHGPIPGLDLRTASVNYVLEGTLDAYREKQYGARPLPSAVSPAALEGLHPAWDIRQAYDQLWEKYSHLIVDHELDPEEVSDMLHYYLPALTVSSIPAPALCLDMESHAFSSVASWALGDAPELGQVVPVPCPEFTVVCNGSKHVGYHRVSNVFGYKTAEWPAHRKPPITGVAQFSKPLKTTCTCHSSVLRVGRYGTWTKGVLSHEAFNTTATALAELRVER